MIEFKLNPSERKLVPLEHKILRVLFASGSFQVMGEDFNPFELRNKQTVDLEKPREITILNHNAQVITVRIESTPFKVSELDAVEIAEGSLVGIAPGSTIDIGEVTMAADAEIAVKAGSDIAVNNFPAVQDAQVTNFPAVQDVAGSVDVLTLPKVKPYRAAAANGLPMVTFAGTTHTIAGNAARKRLEIICDIGNSGLVWIGSNVANAGIPLAAGEAYDGEITEALELAADVGAKIYLLESVEV